jgi:uncharacterized membrane protein YoaK (UPF0700 family)
MSRRKDLIHSFGLVWFGLCLGVGAGIWIGIWIEEKSAWLTASFVIFPSLTFIAFLPQAVQQIAVGVRRFRSAAGDGGRPELR